MLIYVKYEEQTWSVCNHSSIALTHTKMIIWDLKFEV